jgi:hypothetical protein
MHWRVPLTLFVTSSLLAAPISGFAQGAVSLQSLQREGSASAPTPGTTTQTAPPPAPTTLRLQEGTEVDLSIDDSLSSRDSEEGDRFTITLTDPITLADGVVIPAGYRGRGEVTSVERNGMLGKSGKLSVRLDYLAIGDTRVPLRANKAQSGANNVGTTIALTILVTPLFLLLKGGNANIHRGQQVTGYVDETTTIPAPLPPPPQRD